MRGKSGINYENSRVNDQESILADIQLLALAILGITPDANTQSEREYEETSQDILAIAKKYNPYQTDI